jgi:Tol biopolymer transport system component
MKNAFGPWATSMNTSPGLNTFWARRLTLLPSLRRGTRGTTRRQLLRLVALGMLFLALPLVRVREPLAAEEPATKSAGKGRLLVWRETKFVFVTPDGKEVGELPGHPDNLILNEPVLSPDGRRVAFTVNEDPPTDKDGNHRRHVFVRDVDGNGPGFKVAINALSVAWTSDGKGLVAPELLPAKEIKDVAISTWLVDVATKGKTRLDLPKLAHPFGVTPDGKSFIATVYDLDARKIHLGLISRDGKQVTKLTEVRNDGPDPRVSPDGRLILFQDFDPADPPKKDMPRLRRLFVYDLRAKKQQRLADMPLNGLILGYCWSPDGQHVAYTWKQVQPGVPLAENTNHMNDPKLNTETESHLMVADMDGKNAKTLMSMKAKSGPAVTIGPVDWR